ncbi:MAG: hypothetical protein WCL44_07945, partial [bacterium]
MKRSKAVHAVLISCMAIIGASLVQAQDGSETTPATSPSSSKEDTGGNGSMALQIPAAGPQKEELVSFNVVDTELGEIVKTFTRLPGVNIVISSNITGKVTASLQNVPWKSALDA